MFFGKGLAKVLTETRKVKICGVRFVIQRLSPLEYMDGSAALEKLFDVYKSSPDKLEPSSFAKVKKHFVDVFCAAVVSPALSRKPDEPGKICVENLFSHWELVTQLHAAIYEFTYGKKKLR